MESYRDSAVKTTVRKFQKSQSEVNAAALEYAADGWQIIPVAGKKPRLENWPALATSDEEKLLALLEGHPGCNIGVKLGPQSNLIDVECDDDAAESALQRRFGGEIPATATYQSRRGKHRLFRYTGDLPDHGRAVVKIDGIEFRTGTNGGAQSVLPPSIHPKTGEQYRWLPGLSPSECGIAELPAEFIAGLWNSPDGPPHEPQGKYAPPQYKAALAAGTIHNGQRDNMLLSFAGTIARAVDPSDPQAVATLTKAVGGINQAICSEPLPSRDVERIARQAIGYRRRDVVAPNGTQITVDLISGAADDDDEKESLVKRLADAICAGERFAKDAGGRLYRFAEGTYKSKGESLIKERVLLLCDAWQSSNGWSTRLGEEVCERIRILSPQLWERPPLDVLNVANGLLRVSDRTLLPHSPDFLSPVQLPVKYDPQASCPKIEKFIGEVFPEGAALLAYELAGWLMLPNTSIQKAVLLVGEGGNGKSRFLRLLVAFVGSNNTSALSLHKLESDRFAAARLIGKLANVCADLPKAHLVSTNTFKAITGGDEITAEYKFRDSFDFMPYCRLLFSANQLPQSNDASQGFFDRWLVVPFDRGFRGTAAEILSTQLDAMLAEPRELSGLLNLALDALAGLQQRRAFTMPPSIIAAAEDFRQTTDPLAVWLKHNTVSGGDAIVAMSDLRDAYNQATGDTMSKMAFGQAIKRLRQGVDEKQRKWKGRDKVWCYVGIGLLANNADGLLCTV